MTRILILAIILLVGFVNSAKADEDFWKAVAARSDVTITTDKNTKLRAAEFKGGVTMRENKNGEVVGVDNSKHGAIFCALEIYLSTKKITQVCNPDSDQDFINTLNEGIDRINSFIATNSLTPITKTEVNEATNKRFQAISDHMGSRMSAEECKVQYSEWVGILASPEKLKKSIDDLLSVPRPPVFEPCL